MQNKVTFYDEIIESVINGNWSHNKEIVKDWSAREYIDFVEYAEGLGHGEVVKQLFKY